MQSTTLDVPHNLSDTVILFLDIDGVLLPFGQLLFPEPQLEAFSMILQAFVPRIRVVLSSTWRVKPEFIQDIVHQLQSYGHQYGGPLTDFEFMDITDPTMHSERHYEIDAWLLRQQSGPPLAWLALDDEDLLLGGTQHSFQGHAVKTDSHDGLTEEKAQVAIQLLRKQCHARQR